MLPLNATSLGSHRAASKRAMFAPSSPHRHKAIDRSATYFKNTMVIDYRIYANNVVNFYFNSVIMLRTRTQYGCNVFLLNPVTLN